MIPEVVLLTRDGYELKKKQLEEYRQILHDEIPKRLKVASEHGRELRENKEYLDIKREQEFYEAEVRRLEKLLDIADVIDEKSISTEFVGIGTKVILEDRERRKVDTLEVVSPAEADLEEGKISVDSPVGSAVKGLHIGEEVDVGLPSGKRVKYRIVGIER